MQTTRVARSLRNAIIFLAVLFAAAAHAEEGTGLPMSIQPRASNVRTDDYVLFAEMFDATIAGQGSYIGYIRYRGDFAMAFFGGEQTNTLFTSLTFEAPSGSGEFWRLVSDGQCTQLLGATSPHNHVFQDNVAPFMRGFTVNELVAFHWLDACVEIPNVVADALRAFVLPTSRASLTVGGVEYPVQNLECPDLEAEGNIRVDLWDRLETRYQQLRVSAQEVGAALEAVAAEE